MMPMLGAYSGPSVLVVIVLSFCNMIAIGLRHYLSKWLKGSNRILYVSGYRM